MKIDVLDVLGKKVSTLDLLETIFDVEPHNQAMFDLIMSERASKRQGTHNTKTRSEVSGGGRKPWRQKGTGRARQGSIRSPQWRGGGVVFGPKKNKNYELKVNRKVKKLAIKSGWTLKYRNNELVILNEINFSSPSTSDFVQMMKNINVSEKKTIMLLKGDNSDFNTYLSSRNIVNVLVVPYKELSLEDIINSEAIIITQEVIELIQRGLE